jgi:predicted DNA-binding protein (MmcQ/YjbR family)
MNIEELREYCLKKKAVTEGFPFGLDTLVFKVQNKVFLLHVSRIWDITYIKPQY